MNVSSSEELLISKFENMQMARLHFGGLLNRNNYNFLRINQIRITALQVIFIVLPYFWP